MCDDEVAALVVDNGVFIFFKMNTFYLILCD